MGRRAVLNDNQRDHMLALREANFSANQIADIIGCSRGTVAAFFSIYDAAKDGRPINETYIHTQPAHVRFVQNKLGITPTDKKSEQKAPEQDNTALAMVSLLEAIKTLTASVDAIDQRLSAMQMSIAGARDDANQQTKKLVETINVNGDIQTKEWSAINNKLECIKTNTKPRPWKENN